MLPILEIVNGDRMFEKGRGLSNICHNTFAINLFAIITLTLITLAIFTLAINTFAISNTCPKLHLP